jgi:hypothetical protein
MTPNRFGVPPNASAPSLSQTVTLSTGTFGRWRAFEPVATITYFACTVSVPPGPATSIV